MFLCLPDVREYYISPSAVSMDIGVIPSTLFPHSATHPLMMADLLISTSCNRDKTF